MKITIEEMLVERDIISRQQLERVKEIQKSHEDKSLTDMLLLLGYTTEDVIINFIDITPRFLPVFAEKFSFEYLRKSHKIPLFSNKLVTPGYRLFRTRSETKPVYFTPLYVT